MSPTPVCQQPPPVAPRQADIEIRARRGVVRRLGEWTTAASFDVLASAGVVVLDLLLPRIDAEEIDVHLDVDHGLVTLLVPDDSRILDDDLRWIGRGHLRDRTGSESPAGTVVRLSGEVRRGEVRIRRGGTAILTLLRHGRVGDVRRAYRDGRFGDLGAKPPR